MSDLVLEAPAVQAPPRLEVAASGHRPTERPDREFTSVAAQALQLCLALVDVAALASAGVLAILMDGRFPVALLPVLFGTALGAAFISWRKGYRIDLPPDLGRLALICGGGCLASLAGALVASTTLPVPDRVPVTSMAVAMAAAWAVMGGSRVIATRVLHAWSRAGRLDRKVAVVGLNDISHDIIRRIRSDLGTDARIIGAYCSPLDQARVTHAGVLVRGDIADLVRHSRSGMVDLVVVAMPPAHAEAARRAVDALASTICDLTVVSALETFRLPGARPNHIGADLQLPVRPRPLGGLHAVQKAVFDWVAALALLVICAPAFALIAIAIRMESDGPVLFKQVRSGRNDRKFHILKFRTMYSEFEDPLADRQTTRGDRRITRVGRWLRRTSLDELPQLINVLKGEMSLVGPRPHALGTRAGMRTLEDIAENYTMRLRVKPGITGLAQVNHCRGALHSEEQVLRRTAYDIQYIDQWSLWLDLRILCLTLVRCFSGTNAF